MKTPALLALTCALFLVLAACHRAESKSSAANSADLIERGRHLVEDVALCVDRHSPRLPDGSFDLANWLGGAPLDIKPTVEVPWAPAAPPLRDFLGWTEEEAIAFLTTGQRRAGLPPVLPPILQP